MEQAQRGDFEVNLDTPDGYMPVGVIGITTGQIKWSIIQFRANQEDDNLSLSLQSYDSSSRTATVRVYVAFVKVS